jgi:Carboxypeptidase Taq (M32) metallopeptidase
VLCFFSSPQPRQQCLCHAGAAYASRAERASAQGTRLSSLECVDPTPPLPQRALHAAGALPVTQDVHHAAGAFGYFPSYTLGAILACQFYAAASRANPGLDDKIAAGDFAPLKEWLNKVRWHFSCDSVSECPRLASCGNAFAIA